MLLRLLSLSAVLNTNSNRCNAMRLLSLCVRCSCATMLTLYISLLRVLHVRTSRLRQARSSRRQQQQGSQLMPDDSFIKSGTESDAPARPKITIQVSHSEYQLQATNGLDESPMGSSHSLDRRLEKTRSMGSVLSPIREDGDMDDESRRGSRCTTRATSLMEALEISEAEGPASSGHSSPNSPHSGRDPRHRTGSLIDGLVHLLSQAGLRTRRLALESNRRSAPTAAAGPPASASDGFRSRTGTDVAATGCSAQSATGVQKAGDRRGSLVLLLHTLRGRLSAERQSLQQQYESSCPAAVAAADVSKEIRKRRHVKSAASARRERRATITLAIVLFAFLSCWIPFFVLNCMPCDAIPMPTAPVRLY